MAIWDDPRPDGELGQSAASDVLLPTLLQEPLVAR